MRFLNIRYSLDMIWSWTPDDEIKHYLSLISGRGLIGFDEFEESSELVFRCCGIAGGAAAAPLPSGDESGNEPVLEKKQEILSQGEMLS